jgi:hypothetical protein
MYLAHLYKKFTFEGEIHQAMPIQKVTYGTKAESKAESLKQNLARTPEERFRLFIELSALYLSLYPDVPAKRDNNFHIYPNER